MPLTFDKPVVVQLRDAECLTLDAVWLNVLHGRVWVTRAGDPDDYFIDAPRAVRLEAGCRGLVSAEGPAQIALMPAPSRWHAWRSRAAQWWARRPWRPAWKAYASEAR